MRFMCLAFLLMLVVSFLSPGAYAQLDATTCYENGLKELDAEVDKKIDVELIAMQNKIEYPLKEPAKPWADVYKDALRKVEEDLAENVKIRGDEDIFLEVSKKYAPFKVGDRISIVPSVKYKKSITGRYQGKIGMGHVHIGSHWIPLLDMDPDTAARFDKDECDALIKKKFLQIKRKQNIKINDFRKSATLKTVQQMLLDNGYLPKDTNETSPSYLDVSNWESQVKRIEGMVSAEKKKLKEQMEDEYMDAYMAKNGFVYDESGEVWRSKTEIKQAEEPKQDPPPEEKPKQGIMDKFKKIFK